MKLKQIAVNIENSPGRLFEVTRILEDAGISLRALNLVDTGELGILRLIVTDLAKTRRILMEKQLPAIVDNVVAVEFENKPGQLAEMLKPLHTSGVRVVYMYTYIGSTSEKTILIFRFSDNDKAIDVLRENGIRLIDAEALGIR